MNIEKLPWCHLYGCSGRDWATSCPNCVAGYNQLTKGLRAKSAAPSATVRQTSFHTHDRVSGRIHDFETPPKQTVIFGTVSGPTIRTGEHGERSITPVMWDDAWMVQWCLTDQLEPVRYVPASAPDAT